MSKSKNRGNKETKKPKQEKKKILATAGSATRPGVEIGGKTAK